jgi:PAS domain S-box-containing protein
MVVILAMMSLFGAYFLINYLLIQRRTLKSLATLQAGAAVIGSGNLDFKIYEKKNDEIGDLSRAFNRMTDDLKTVTASKADLEKEIVERKRAEEELRRQREWLQVTLSSIGDAVIATDTSGRISFLNPVAQTLTGWQPAEAERQPVQSVFRIINEKSREPGEDIIQRVLHEGVIITLANNTALITRDGREIPIEDSAAPISDNDGHVSGVVLVFHDVTEKRRAQEKLRESEARYRNLFEAMSEGFALHEIICDDGGQPSDYRFLQVNPAFERQTGLKAGDIVGRTLYEVLPQSESLWVERYGSVALTGESARFDQWSETLGRHYEVSAFQTEKGRFGVLFLDITERKKAEEVVRQSRDELERRVQERTAELRRTNEELQQRNRDLEDFAHVASHDLQEPLRKIQTFADLLSTSYHGSVVDKAGDYLERMRRAAGRMQALVLDLLRYSRVTSNQEPFARFNLREVVEEAVTDLGVLSEETGGRIEVGDLPDIEADRVQMRQLFQNLIANGLKYRGEEKPVVRVYSNPSPGSFWEIHVSDNGIGFDECYLDKIFKPFQRLHGKDAPYEGTGMGLAICRRIVERHGGSITAKSEPGKGATFIMKLPKKR